MPHWIERAAIAAHEANRAYCTAIGDDSQVPWVDAPEWHRVSAIAGVKFIVENPYASPSASHECWLALKTSEGWTYGPVKDPEKKQHPCCVPYDDLPEAQKAKDMIFGAVVRGVIAHFAPRR